MLTCIDFSPPAIGKQTARCSVEGIPEGTAEGFPHQLRSFSMHSLVDAGMSISPGDGNIAVRRSITDN